MTKTFSQNYYQQRIAQDLLLKHNYTSVMEIPRMQKIVCHITSKNFLVDRTHILPALLAIECITGQKPKYTQAKQSIAGFKLREGQVLGCSVTLRRAYLHAFFEKYLCVVLPHRRDFVPQSIHGSNFDGSFVNMTIFPELQKNYDIFAPLHGLEIHIVSSAQTQEEALVLYSAFQIPLTSMTN